MKETLLYLILVLIACPTFSQVLNDNKVEADKGFFNFYYEEKQDKINQKVDKLDHEFLFVNNHALGEISKTYDKKRDVNPYAAQYTPMISGLREHPKKFKLEPAPHIPDGSPIGTEACDYILN